MFLFSIEYALETWFIQLQRARFRLMGIITSEEQKKNRFESENLVFE